MQPDNNHAGGKPAKGKKYPIKHKRPTGQVIERGPSQFMVWLHSHTDAEGKPVRYTKTFKTLKEADAHLTEKVVEKNRRRFRAETGERLSELIERYMRQEAPEKMRPHTLAVRHYYMRRYVFPELGYRKARDITHDDVRGLYNKLQETTSERTGRKLAKGTVRLVHQTLRAILSFYVRVGELLRNPCEHAGLSCEKGLKTLPLTKQQIPQFLAALERLRERNSRHYSHRIGPLFPLAFESGLRPEEYIGLTLDAVSLDGESPYISVRRVAVRHPQVKGKWWFDEPKTVRSRRLVPITKELAALLREHIKRTERRKRKVREWQEHRLLFPNTVGEPHYMHRIQLVFKETIAEMGLDPKSYRLYGTRHAMASAALTEKIHPKVVAERLGHSSISTTLDTYSHVFPTMQDDATEKLGGIIYGREEREGEQVLDVDVEEFELPF